ncbi:MAG TPA: cyclic pyranopterin monophosphate synthase MoaC [Syntrophales bacterium]|nr:cyclic pyranopterin monophosphate synthase MoaC [Syntrophales bacterium]HOL60243.1 cyclic pyranopterin monophosphate synthase MoaC [Syntrophales bacterium]HPO34619.1 cyclic pyranopterin monophosphate synthase MoaC [Syntrophales bacterium]
MTKDTLTHLDKRGYARMVDVTAKEETLREATARARLSVNPETMKLITENGIPKGDVFGVARIAAIMAAKKTGQLIPLCHPLEITGVEVEFLPSIEKGEIIIEAQVKTRGRTGVEMEAMTAVAIGALTIYDMCKGVDKNITITEIALQKKRGGKSGEFQRHAKKD